MRFPRLNKLMLLGRVFACSYGARGELPGFQLGDFGHLNP